jgi:hypothetical protein
MAYDRRAQLPTYVLRFEHLPGLTVKMRRPGLAGLEDITSATAVLRRSVREGWPEMDRRNLKAWRRLCRAFAASLESWDLVDAGEPVAPTLDGVLAQDLELLIDLVQGWQHAMSGTQASLSEDERDGGVDDVADDTERAPGPYVEGEPFDPENPRLDEEWLAQLPVESEPSTSGSEPVELRAVSHA